MDAVYEVRGDIAVPGDFVAGPWDAGMQHGSAPTALIARTVERLPSQVPMQVVRLTVDLLRPVPIRPLEIKAEVVREGRKIQLCAARLLADGKEVVRASVLKIRSADVDLPAATPLGAPLTLPTAERGRLPHVAVRNSSPFISGFDLSLVKGDFRGGPGACWFRVRRPLVLGEAPTPLMRAAVAADFCNATAAVLDARRWTFLNADLSIHLTRMPVGEWVLLDAETWLGAAGNGLAFGRLADERGYFGRAVQSLVVERP